MQTWRGLDGEGRKSVRFTGNRRYLFVEELCKVGNVLTISAISVELTLVGLLNWKSVPGLRVRLVVQFYPQRSFSTIVPLEALSGLKSRPEWHMPEKS